MSTVIISKEYHEKLIEKSMTSTKTLLLVKKELETHTKEIERMLEIINKELMI